MKKHFRFVLAAIVATFCLGVAGVAEANAQVGKIRETLTRLDTFNNRITTLRADITMGKQNGQLKDDPDIWVGTALYAKRKGVKDASVRIDWKKPDESLAVVDGKYKIYRPRLKTLYTGSSKNVSKGTKGSSALVFMNMSKAQLQASYEVSYVQEETLSSGIRTIHLLLTPKTKASYKSADLWVDVDGRPLQSRIVEWNDDTTTVLLTNVIENSTLSPADFDIVPQPGTKVLKG